jgi:hypothetical protein
MPHLFIKELVLRQLHLSNPSPLHQEHANLYVPDFAGRYVFRKGYGYKIFDFLKDTALIDRN